MCDIFVSYFCVVFLSNGSNNVNASKFATFATKTEKNIFNRLVRCQEFKIISIRLEIRNQHVEMHQIPSMKEKSATSSAKPVSLTVQYLYRKKTSIPDTIISTKCLW